MTGRFRNWLDDRLNNLKIKKKLFLLYFYCMILPLVLTDAVIIGLIVKREYDTKQETSRSIVSAVKYSLNSAAEETVMLSKNIYFNKYINEFLNTEFQSTLDYYNQYQELLKDSLFDSLLGTSNSIIRMYADNDTIVNGGRFWRMESVEEEKWYRDFMDSGQNMQMYFYYEDAGPTNPSPVKKLSFVRKLDRYKRDKYNKLLRIDLDYNAINQGMTMANYGGDVYVCSETGQILLSNTGLGNSSQNYSNISSVGYRSGEYTDRMAFYGQELTIYVMPYSNGVGEVMIKSFPILVLMLLINVLFPWIFMNALRRNFVERIGFLSRIFNYSVEGRLEEIKNIHGTDEIASLMRNYNIMAQKTNSLIETVYKSRLKQQEMNIARQKAELLALHGQINPHFLFNILENIRMRSVLKQEYETADMIEQLAVMERQYVEWGTDMVTIGEEKKFVEAYLRLQKYRFGDRLSYSIEIQKECADYKIPKLSLVTFAENSCVHGIEDKAAKCWIFVKAYRQEEKLYLEVEDTGSGMPESYLYYLRERMENANIEMLREKGRVGVINACLRLKMQTDGNIHFSLESEKMVGTIVTISAPVKYFREGDKDAEGTVSR